MEEKKYRKFTQLKKSLHVLGFIGQKGFGCFQICVGNLIEEAIKFYQNQQLLIIMDNCPIHHSNYRKSKIFSQFNVLFLPSYSPQLNPMEGSLEYLKINNIQILARKLTQQ
ncbi:unnamed protein product [Paramecium pentaurelia]|nr:unnamed protein product [Paramecium pentaurelia]